MPFPGSDAQDSPSISVLVNQGQFTPEKNDPSYKQTEAAFTPGLHTDELLTNTDALGITTVQYTDTLLI